MRSDRGEVYRIVWAALLVLVVVLYTGYGGIGLSELGSLTEDTSSEAEEVASSAAEEAKESTSLNRTALKMEIHEEVNERRESRGLNPLVYNEDLDSMAQSHSEDMAERGYYSHTSPDGVSMSDRYREANIGCAGAENIFRTTGMAGDEADLAEFVVDSWMGSEGHRANLLGDHSLEGIGVAVGEYEGKENLFVTQNFC